MNTQNMADRVYADPRGQSEAAWLDTIDFLTARLAEATSAHLHIGGYRCEDDPGCARASISCWLRSRTPLPGTDSDYWEGGLRYTGGAEQAEAEAYVFPFRDGSPVFSSDTLAADGGLEELRSWQLVDGRFVDRGWCCAEKYGPLEGRARKPGDQYWHSVKVRADPAGYRAGAPIVVGLSNLVFPTAPGINR